MTDQEENPDGYAPEEIAAFKSIFRITWKILRHPLRFAQYREPGALKQARAYMAKGLVVALGLGPLLGWLAHQGEGPKQAALDSSAHGVSASLSGYYNPDALPVGQEVFAILLAAGLYFASLLLHYGLIRFGNRTVPRVRATALCFYLTGFYLFGFSALETVMFGLQRLAGGGSHQSPLLAAAIVIFAVIPMVYFVCLSLMLLCEWPRRLYAIRARRYYLVVFLLACVAQGAIAIANSLPNR